MGCKLVFFVPLLLLLSLAYGGLIPDVGGVISQLKKSKFQSFLNQHSLFFTDAKERDHRLNIFSQNLDKIDELNARKAGGEDATFGINQFTHLTFDEFKALMLTPDNFNMSAHVDKNAKSGPTRLTQGNFTLPFHSQRSKRQTPPTSFDWRTYGYITPVKNQGACGCCWAFAAAGVTEISYALQYGGLIDLAEQELVNCETVSSGCNGGYPDKALDYIRTKGIHYETSLPYSASQSSCGTVNGGKVQTIATDNLAGYTEDQMRDYLYNYGPFTNAWAVEDSFQHYVSGIFNPTTCPTINHAMITVGYGVQNGQNYWIVKNQWGTGWGEAGYIRVPRGVNKCGFKTYNLSPYF